MMNEQPQGLAAQGAQPQAQDEQMMLMIEKVIEALEAGITPEELIAKGVPEEVIQAAMQMMNQEQGGEGVEEPQVQQPAPGGLAGMQV